MSTDVRMAHGCPVLKPTGSSIGNRYHKPVNSNEFSKLNTFVTVLRHPKERFISNFCDGAPHHHGLNDELKNEMQLKLTHGNKFDNLTAVHESLSHYNSLHYVYGCYVKMLTGFMCSDADVVVNEELTKKAIENLNKFLFVGISVNYQHTVNSFISLMSTAVHVIDPSTFKINKNKNPDEYIYKLSKPDSIEYKIIGENSHNTNCEKIVKMLIDTKKILYNDTYDELIYNHAYYLFKTKFNMTNFNTMNDINNITNNK